MTPTLSKFRMRILTLITTLVLISGILTACNSTPKDGPVGWQPFNGKVVWVNPWGSHGFFALKTREFGKITPILLEKQFQRIDMKIKGELLLKPDVIGRERWGRVAELRNVEMVAPPPSDN